MKSRAIALASTSKGRISKTIGMYVFCGERNRVHLAKMFKTGANVLPL
jgi:hypothetical protein